MTNAEIDRMVAEKVMGWTVIEPDHPYREFVKYGGCISEGSPQRLTIGVIPHNWSPSTDMNHAMEVVGAMREKHVLYLSIADIDDRDSKTWNAVFGRDDRINGELGEADADTAPIAICLAALKAVGVEVDQCS